MKRSDFYEDLHKKNLKAFENLVFMITKGVLRIVDIRIERPEFGNQIVVISLHEEEHGQRV